MTVATRELVLVTQHDCHFCHRPGRALQGDGGAGPDPICGMLIDPAQAPARLATGDDVLYFCSRGCRDKYEQERVLDEAV